MVYGVGYDSGGEYSKTCEGKHTKCYSTWKDMLRRCYSPLYQNKNETYIGCKVSDNWLDFQMFAEWFYSNHVNGYHLDKDILGDGKLYSSNTCVFIPKALNLLLVNTSASKSRNHTLPLGVSSSGRSFIAYSNNGDGKTVNLGSRNNAEDAFTLYKKYKEELIRSKAWDLYNKYIINSEVRDALLEYEIKPFI